MNIDRDEKEEATRKEHNSQQSVPLPSRLSFSSNYNIQFHTLEINKCIVEYIITSTEAHNVCKR